MQIQNCVLNVKLENPYHLVRVCLVKCLLFQALKPKMSIMTDITSKEIWKKKRHYSEVSGVYLGKEPMSTYFHHILPKEKYPEACLDEENIILLTLEEHSNVENDMYRYEEVNKRRNHLLTKYERS
jgi:hypothetical protein